ncbi:MAG: oxidoreductase [Actinomycetia bacterium]|nr:oxidoreductase [Actinomycetes bacterium]
MEGEVVNTWLTLVVFVLPFAGGLLAAPLAKVSRATRSVGLCAVCAATLVAAASFVPGVLSGKVYETHILKLTPTIWMYMRVDALGALFGLTVAALWMLALVYSLGYMADEQRLGRYYSFFMLCLAWTMGVAYSGNLLTFLIFYELFSILTYPLVVQEGTPQAMAAGTKYIIYILVGGSLVLLAIVFTFFVAGDQTLSTTPLLDITMGQGQLRAIFWCFIAGFGVKAAIVPLHGWVPDAHPAAPAPFSAVLSGVMVAAGTFGIMRVVFNVFGVALLRELDVTRWLSYLAALTVIFAAILAVNQDNIKRRLAYSTISQMGYVTLGVSLLGEQAAVGAMVHITNHAFMKGALFLVAGLLIKRAGVHNVSEIDGMAKRMPFTCAALAIVTLGMIGTPPLSGFVSKWYLGLGILEAQQPLYLIVLIGGALIAAIYLLPMVYRAYFREPRPLAEGVSLASGADVSREAPVSMLAPLGVAVGISIVLGLLASVEGSPLSLARVAAESFFR